MSTIGVLGIGCVSPLGADWPAVWAGISAGRRPEAAMLPGLEGHPPLPAYRVPGPFEFRHPRLRRSSAISHFACAAASAAVAEAGPLPADRSALVFASSDGSLIYTRKFYGEVVASGAGSPLMFPETVYNAPASHVAAVLGVEGSVLTMVGDETAGLDAINTAIDLIRSGEADRCLVIASQEVDWIACDGYRRWGIASSGGLDEPILSEGAVAMVLGAGRPGDAVIAKTSIGFPGRSGSAKWLRGLMEENSPDSVVTSDVHPEQSRSRAADFPGARIFAPKILCGESFSVSALLQFACAAQEIREALAGHVLVSVAGWNGAVGGAALTASALRE